MRSSRGLSVLFAGFMVLGFSSGCGIQQRSFSKPGAEEADEDRSGFREPGKAEKREQAAFDGAGFSWAIRSANPRTDSHPSSAWELGEVAPARVLVDGAAAGVSDPVAWPDEPDSVLMVQIRSARAGDWSARCILADESAEESIPVRRMEWDPESESLLLPLSEVFGKRGERRDPASICHLLVRLQAGAEWRSFRLSLRVLSGLPVPAPIEHRDHEWATGQTLREELWRNVGFRNLDLELGADPKLTQASVIEIQAFIRHREGTRLYGERRRFHSRTGAIQLEARVLTGPTWSAWSGLPLRLHWPAGSELRVEYRLAPARGARVCSLADREVRRVWGVDFGKRLSRVSQSFQGGVQWKARVLDPAKVRAGGAPRESSRAELREAGALDPVLEGSPFDCQGWVP